MTSSTLAQDRPTQLNSLGSLVLFHLLPAVPGLLSYSLLSALMASRDVPNLMALMIIAVAVEAPVLWWVMARLGRQPGEPLANLFPWSRKLRLSTYLLWGIPAALFSMAMMGAVGPAAGEALREAAFAWAPDWLVMDGSPETMLTASRGVVMTMWGLSAVMVLVAGPTQELYFRGFLLPRMAHLGWKAPLLNAALFAVFHLIAPWSWPVFFLGTLPWALLVYWKRSVRIGLFAHVGMLSLQWLMLTMMAFGVIGA